jgi:hypothetical protein
VGFIGSVCGGNGLERGPGNGTVATVFFTVAAVECQNNAEFFQKKSASPSPAAQPIF